MNESENLLVIALGQLGVLPQNSQIKSLTQVTNDEFARMLLQICRKISNVKGISTNLPENLANDLNSKYRECQKIVDFIKQLGLKFDVNLNNVLFPSHRDMQRLLEYTLEYLTNVDTGVMELGENLTEKNFSKIKMCKEFQKWTKEMWIVPGLEDDEESKSDLDASRLLLKFEKTKLSGLRKKMNSQSQDVPEKSKR